MSLPVIHLDRPNQAAFTGWSGEAINYAGLPIASSVDGQFWMVLNPSGSRFLFTYKASGLYLSESGAWRKINNAQLLLNDDQFSVYNAADNTKQITFDASAIATATKRTYTFPNKDGFVAMLSDITAEDKGIEGFFLQARGLFGTGQGWADNGFIGDVPMLLYANSITEKAVYSFFALSRAKFDTVNPIVSFAIYSVGAPIITTGDQVRWQLEVRYIAEGELATKTPDETILLTQTLTVLLSDARQEQIDFTLDRTLISDQDSIQLTLSRLGGDVADTYGGDIGVGQSGITIQTTNHNP